ncbi:hypothetical protein H072_9816 [Dactylellina haptotyla CBS 200.50]|uniref:Uncharacterized protein n=1 Tax=Dactylellina haptotyla (strain CBS 200.50) TaxID=1284197 RepID=S8A612_DACHA|nr:hypothetical protein H072_9816 [Dactylellina haptotyla CBS 200.50]
MLPKRLLFGVFLLHRTLAQDPGNEGGEPESPDTNTQQVQDPIPVDILPENIAPATSNFNIQDDIPAEPSPGDEGLQDELAAINFAMQSTGAPPTEEQLAITAPEETSPEAQYQLNMQRLATWSSEELANTRANRNTTISNGQADQGPPPFEQYTIPRQPGPGGYVGPPIGDYSWRTSVVLTKPQWNGFVQGLENSYNGSDTLTSLWRTCALAVAYRKSIDSLLVAAHKYAKLKDPELAKRVNTAYDALWRKFYYVSNRNFGVPKTKYPTPGICDETGILGAPTGKQTDALPETKLKLLEDLFMYEPLARDEISISDDYFLTTWNSIDQTLSWLDEWELGYAQYWDKKYGVVYKYIPKEFGYWDMWNSPTNLDYISEMPEKLLYALHATVVGLVRGVLPVVTEMFVDIGYRAWLVANESPLGKEEDFARPGANGYARTGFGFSEEFFIKGAERGEVNYRKLGSAKWNGEWDDKAQIAKNQWRDESLAKLYDEMKQKANAPKSDKSVDAIKKKMATQGHGFRKVKKQN